MKNFTERTSAEQEIIRKAYDFEIMAIETDNTNINPYLDTIKAMENGTELWEAINVAVELAYN